LLIVALVLGFSTSILSLTVLSTYIKTEQVVIAVRDIEPYQRISLKDVRLAEVPVKALAPSSVKRVESVLGAYAVSRLCAGQILMAGHVISGQDEIGISFDLPSYQRAVMIPATPSRAVGGLVKPGDRVDVIWTGKASGFYDENRFRGAITVLKGAQVIEVVKDPSSKDLSGIVVLASPEVCESLAYYLESGPVYLTLAPRFEDELQAAKMEGGVAP